MWVASPQHHRALFEHVYSAHRQTPHSYCEQAAFSSEIIRRGLHHCMDTRFNVLWLEYRVAFYTFLLQVPAMMELCIATALRNSFFLHFAAIPDDMRRVDPRVVADFEQFAMPPDQIEQVARAWKELAAR